MHSIPVGCLPRGGVCQAVWPGVSAWGVSVQGGCLPEGSAQWGVSATHTPPVNKITDFCENITLLQLRCGR